jgi:hypothetical protein
MTAIFHLIVLSLLLLLLQLLTLVAAIQPAAPPQPSAAADPPPLRPLADWTAALLTPDSPAADGTLTALRMPQRDGENDSSWGCG